MHFKDEQNLAKALKYKHRIYFGSYIFSQWLGMYASHLYGLYKQNLIRVTKMKHPNTWLYKKVYVQMNFEKKNFF